MRVLLAALLTSELCRISEGTFRRVFPDLPAVTLSGDKFVV